VPLSARTGLGGWCHRQIHDFHHTMNEVGTTPIIHILAIPSLRTHPTIIPHQLAAVCCVVCWLFHEIYTLSMPYPLIIAYKLGPISLFDHFSASPLASAGSQLYPMHMKHNGATRTLLRLLDGVFPNSAYIQCILMRRRQQSGRYSAPALPTTTAPPQNVPLSPLMRLVAPRVAAAALDGGRPWEWGRRRVTIVNDKKEWARITGPNPETRSALPPLDPMW
jgi:hypothetical protein